MEKIINKVFASDGVLIGSLLCLFLVFPWLSHRIDSGAASLDAGVLSLILITLLSMIIFKTVSWLLLRTVWPCLGDYVMHCMAEDFRSLDARSRLFLFCGAYFLMILGFVATLAAIN